MKNLIRSIELAGSGAVLSAFFAAAAYAGPGAQYWQTVGQKASHPGESPAAAAAPVCPGSQIVPVTVMKPAWANGRGPLAPVPVGTKRVCTVCPVTSTATTMAANGRGPVARVETTKTGVPHDCTATCPAPKA